MTSALSLNEQTDATSHPLPLELFEYIINYLSEDESSLKQCTLTCSLFRVLAQRQLFKRITIGRPTRIKETPSEKFLNLIRNSPHLTGSVKRLDIRDNDHRKFYREEKSWIRSNRTLPGILSSLLCLEELRIVGYEYGRQLDFGSWSPSLQSSILSKSVSLVKLTLFRTKNIPLALLNSLPILKTLSLLQVLFKSSPARVEEAPLLPSSQISHLRTLRITTTSINEWRSIYPYLLAGAHSLYLQNLELLSLRMDFGWFPAHSADLQATKWLINQSRQTLKVFDVLISEDESVASFYGQPIFEVSEMPVLEDLTLRVCLWDYGFEFSGFYSGLRWLIRHLGTIPSSRKLRSIHLHMIIFDSKSVEIQQGIFDNYGWEELEELVLKLESQTSMLSIEFSISGLKNFFVKALLQQLLPVLYERQLYRIKLNNDNSLEHDELS